MTERFTSPVMADTGASSTPLGMVFDFLYHEGGLYDVLHSVAFKKGTVSLAGKLAVFETGLPEPPSRKLVIGAKQSSGLSVKGETITASGNTVDTIYSLLIPNSSSRRDVLLSITRETPLAGTPYADLFPGTYKPGVPSFAQLECVQMFARGINHAIQDTAQATGIEPLPLIDIEKLAR